MRGHGALLAVLFVIPFAGCIGGSDSSSTPEVPRPGGLAGTVPAGNGSFRAEPPNLTVGQSWTYTTTGVWDLVPELTIVVARVDVSGARLAAQSQEMLLDKIAWDHGYLGEVDEGLRALGRDGRPGGGRFLDLPLWEGKNWSLWSVPLVAHEADVKVLGATERGFVIEGANEHVGVRIEYATSVGYIVRFQEVYLPTGWVSLGLELTSMGRSETWAWFEREAEVFGMGLLTQPGSYDPTMAPAGDTPFSAPLQLVVPETADAVFAWTVGSAGSTGLVAPPPGGPMVETAEGRGEPNAEMFRFDASPGTWLLTGIPGDGNGWFYMQGHAVRWLGPDSDLLGNA